MVGDFIQHSVGFGMPSQAGFALHLGESLADGIETLLGGIQGQWSDVETGLRNQSLKRSGDRHLPSLESVEDSFPGKARYGGIAQAERP